MTFMSFGFPKFDNSFDEKKEVEILEGRPNWLRDWLDAPKFHKTLATGLHATYRAGNFILEFN